MVEPVGRRSGHARADTTTPGADQKTFDLQLSRIAKSVMLAGAILIALLANAASRPAFGDHLIAAVATKGSPHQPFGADVLYGVTQAAEQFNAAGGILGAQVRVVGWSEDCSRERASQIAEEIVRLKPSVVIGHLCAGAAMTAAPIYAKAGVLLIAPGVRHPRLTAEDTGGLVLRLGGREDRFARDTVDVIRSRYPGQGVAIVADRTRQATGLAVAVAAELSRQNIVLSLDERIESGEKSYEALAARVRHSGAGVVVMPAQPFELDVLLQSLRRAGSALPLVGSEILAVPSLMPTAQREADRLVLMLPWTGQEAKQPVPAGGADPQRGDVRRLSHAAVEVWVSAARRAGTVEAAAVAAAARTATANTAAGPLRFDRAGDALVPSYVPHVWRDGAWRALTQQRP
jgi:branched-chain amino acid transport system substrate-binding protein